jgi:hypothetical protein
MYSRCIGRYYSIIKHMRRRRLQGIQSSIRGKKKEEENTFAEERTA